MLYKVIDKLINPFLTKPGDAGLDMYSTEDTWIFPFIPRKVKLNIAIELPEQTFGLMTSRSGFSLKGNFVIPGIIDETFRGQVSATMVRFNILPKKIKKGTRVAQLIIIPYLKPQMEKTEKELSETERGDKGYGHTGVA